jgi:hypothetical protein
MEVRGILACAAVMVCGAWSVAPQSIVVTPDAPRPGQRVHISVPGCGTGPTPHTANSAAFAGDVTLYGKADTGDAEPTIRQELKPGTYPITAHCGANHTVLGAISVAADRPSAGHEHARRTADYWLLASAALILAAIAGTILLRRRGRD